MVAPDHRALFPGGAQFSDESSPALLMWAHTVALEPPCYWRRRNQREYLEEPARIAHLKFADLPYAREVCCLWKLGLR